MDIFLKKLERTEQKLRLFYAVNFAIIIIPLAWLIFYHGFKGVSLTGQDFSYERIGIILMLALIPATFKIYHSKIKKLTVDEMFLSKYEKLYFSRLLLIDIVIIYNLFFYYQITSANFVYIAMIGVVSLGFCFPGVDVHGEKKEKQTLEDNEN